MRKSLVACFFVAAACTDSEPIDTTESTINGVPVGEVRGVVDISNTLRTRLFDDADMAAATFDISRVAGDAMFGLREHLGVFAQVGSVTEYQGGLPTPFSMTMWHQVFGRFADAVGQRCGRDAALAFPVYAGGGAAFRLAAPVAQKFDAACIFSGDESARRHTTAAVWDAVMGRGSTLAEEKAAFEAEFAADGSPWVTEAPEERLASMMLVMLLNPHFLLAN
jgi:hypothetical protein